jgi:hypothetical protein
MRTAILTVGREDGSSEPWTETYKESEATWRGLTPSITDVDKWARGLIDYYNDTITHPSEHRRVFISVTVTDDGATFQGEHEWHKTNLVTISDRVGVYDAMKCERCGVTGKRFGVSYVKRDAKFRAKKFERCS